MKAVFRVFKAAGQWKGSIIIATFMLFVVAAINLVTPMIAREVISLVAPGDIGVTRTIWYLGAFLLALFVTRSVCSFINGYFSHYAAFKVIAKLRLEAYENLQRLSPKYYHDKQTGQILARVYDDTWALENLIAHAIPDLVTSIITFIGAMIFMFVINPTLALLMCIPLPFIICISIFTRKLRTHWRKHRQVGGELMALLNDNLQGMKEVQVFNHQKYEAERVHKKVEEHSRLFYSGVFWVYMMHSFMNFIQGAGQIILIIFGGFMALHGHVSAADITAFLMYGGLLYIPVAGLARIIEDIQRGSIAGVRVFEILDAKSDVIESPDARDVGNLEGNVEFKNVSFDYIKDIAVLRDVSFTAPAGKMVALVGSTGAGKTTIAALLARFYDVTGGSIMIDGIDIRDMTLESLRNQISIVLQDVFLFNGTIKDNISYGRADDVSDEEVIAAAKVAAVHDFIDGLPEKYNTVVGERGTRLSGGQKQRIAIARAILRKSPILILDEATSSVDNETEREIQKAIDQIAGTRTLIVIAHRLTTIEKADKVLKLEKGLLAITADDIIKT